MIYASRVVSMRCAFLPTLRCLTDLYHGNRIVLCNWFSVATLHFIINMALYSNICLQCMAPLQKCWAYFLNLLGGIV